MNWNGTENWHRTWISTLTLLLQVDRNLSHSNFFTFTSNNVANISKDVWCICMAVIGSGCTMYAPIMRINYKQRPNSPSSPIIIELHNVSWFFVCDLYHQFITVIFFFVETMIQYLSPCIHILICKMRLYKYKQLLNIRVNSTPAPFRCV